MKRLTDAATVSAVVLLMVIAVLVYLGPRMGFRADNVASSGSMEPTMSGGTMIVAEKVQASTLAAGDIITFKVAGMDVPVCHKITGVTNIGGLSFRTQGDAEQPAQSLLVPATNVLGKVVFNAPVLGHFIQFLRTTYGLVIGLVLPALVIVWLIFRVFWKELVRYIRSSPREG